MAARARRRTARCRGGDGPGSHLAGLATALTPAAAAPTFDSPFHPPPGMATITGMAILVVDDDQAVRDALRRALTMQGYDVEVAKDGEEALLRARANHNAYDLLIVDILMPRLDGLELTRRLRTDGNQLPILMLTARDQVADRVAGLEAGADDYLVKPFALEELVARVRALLRRLGTDDEPAVLSFADLELNTGTREVTRGDETLNLTRTEFALLELFLRNPRQVLTRSVIFDRVWGYDFGYGSNSLDVYISYLRKKTESGGRPRLIHTVRGVGYALREQ
jgi:two-component system response regulator MprA